jgi:hypothetical protein
MSESNGRGLSENGIVIGNGSDQGLSKPKASFALIFTEDDFTVQVCVVLIWSPELYGPSQALVDPSPQSHW